MGGDIVVDGGICRAKRIQRDMISKTANVMEAAPKDFA